MVRYGVSKTHDIEDLVVIAGKKEHSILELKNLGAELSSFAVEVRYPEFEEPSLDDTKIAVEIAEKFGSYVKQKISKDTGISSEERNS